MSSSNIKAIAEVVLNVNDIEVMKAFYTDVMGFPLFSESCHETSYAAEEGEPTIVFLRIGPLELPFGARHPQLLVLIDYQRHKSATERFDGHEVRRSTLNHLAFEIAEDSYDQELERLGDLGLNPTTTQFPAMNAKAIFFSDPECNLLEFICHNQDV